MSGERVTLDHLAGWVPAEHDPTSTVVVLHDGRAFALTGCKLTELVRGGGTVVDEWDAVKPPGLGAALRRVRAA